MKTKANKDAPIIELRNVTKQYSLKQHKPTLVEQLFKRNDLTEFTALDDISLHIFEGESVGIVGHNGSGKTTLLKIIAGIATPNSGRVVVKKRVVSLIDLGAGFNHDLTGRENIFLNGMVLGMSRRELQAVFEEIITFADIGKFIDSPVFTYSEGMRLRLGFSVAVHSNPEILVLDEGVIVGDLDFQEKIRLKVQELTEDKNLTLILVSHSLGLVRSLCQRVILLRKNVVLDGDLSVLDEYGNSKL